MPVCQQCGKQWPDGYAVCPDDGMRMSVHSGTALAATGTLAVAQPQPSDEELPPGTPVGEYVVEKKLGEGGMGAVYGARHPVIGKRAAVKVIKREMSASAEGVDRFVREAQAVNTIGHPNIVDVFGFGRLPDGRSFFVMEWLEGESLRDRMLRPLSFAQSLEVLESIATALQAAHEAGVVHRDLKPDNVFLARIKGTQAPRVKLLDFGLAKLQGGASGEPRVDHTRTGVVMGTPLYLSPEQAKGQRIDAATDIYSLGAMAYELGAGVVPFNAESAIEIMAKHISEAPVPLHARAPWLPPAFVELVEQMLAKDPRARPGVADVVARITAMRAQPEIVNAAPVPGATPVQWTPQSGPVRAPSPVLGAVTLPETAPRKGRGLLVGIILGVVLAGGAAAAFAVLGHSSESQPQVAAREPVATPPAPQSPPVVAPPVETTPAETNPVETTPVETTPVETKPVETTPAETKPVETKPVVTKPVERHAAKLGTVALTIAGAPRGSVFVDGKLVASEVAEASLELAPGEHRVRVQAPGHKPFEQLIRVEAGSKKTLAVELRKKSINAVHDPFAE
ncbi:MAG TPA: protein kinase [Kofleriaceae bacterium]|nr:protein kinase [Kofleriaceae bacterium]